MRDLKQLAPKLAKHILKVIRKSLREYKLTDAHFDLVPPGWDADEYVKLDKMAGKLVLKALRGVKIDAT